jgi:hypothetical protein
MFLDEIDRAQRSFSISQFARVVVAIRAPRVEALCMFRA